MENTQSPEKVTITKFDGFVKFSVQTKITEAEAINLQKDLVYHPAGYGFYGFKPSENFTEWYCSDTCD
jgi:hypothetical protein